MSLRLFQCLPVLRKDIYSIPDLPEPKQADFLALQETLWSEGLTKTNCDSIRAQIDDFGGYAQENSDVLFHLVPLLCQAAVCADMEKHWNSCIELFKSASQIMKLIVISRVKEENANGRWLDLTLPEVDATVIVSLNREGQDVILTEEDLSYPPTPLVTGVTYSYTPSWIKPTRSDFSKRMQTGFLSNDSFSIIRTICANRLLEMEEVAAFQIRKLLRVMSYESKWKMNKLRKLDKTIISTEENYLETISSELKRNPIFRWMGQSLLISDSIIFGSNQSLLLLRKGLMNKYDLRMSDYVHGLPIFEWAPVVATLIGEEIETVAPLVIAALRKTHIYSDGIIPIIHRSATTNPCRIKSSGDFCSVVTDYLRRGLFSESRTLPPSSAESFHKMFLLTIGANKKRFIITAPTHCQDNYRVVVVFPLIGDSLAISINNYLIENFREPIIVDACAKSTIYQKMYSKNPSSVLIAEIWHPLVDIHERIKRLTGNTVQPSADLHDMIQDMNSSHGQQRWQQSASRFLSFLHADCPDVRDRMKLLTEKIPHPTQKSENTNHNISDDRNESPISHSHVTSNLFSLIEESERRARLIHSMEIGSTERISDEYRFLVCFAHMNYVENLQRYEIMYEEFKENVHSDITNWIKDLRIGEMLRRVSSEPLRSLVKRSDEVFLEAQAAITIARKEDIMKERNSLNEDIRKIVSEVISYTASVLRMRLSFEYYLETRGYSEQNYPCLIIESMGPDLCMGYELTDEKEFSRKLVEEKLRVNKATGIDDFGDSSDISLTRDL